MNKEKRKEVFLKYGGRCAYCGEEIEFDTFQVDHLTPKRDEAFMLTMDDNGNIISQIDDIKNLMPSCYECNHYKRASSLKVFREYLLGQLHTRIKRIPKNPRTEKGLKRKRYMETLLKKYHITEDKPFCGVFYFETLRNE